MDHDEMLDRVAAYALGAVTSGETSEILDHLKTCEECRLEYEALSPVVDAVARTSEAEIGPSPLLKARIMHTVRPRSARSFPWLAALAAVACLAAIILGSADVALNTNLANDRLEIARQSRTMGDLVASDANRYPFAKGEVLTRGSRLYVALRALPAPPQGKVYQAWTLARGSKKMRPSVTFRPSNDGVAVIALPVDASTIIAVAVSVEPMGGSRQPTTAPLAIVKIRG